jgi:FkbM family methyltransferase
MKADETYPAYRDIMLRIDNHCLSAYQFWNVVNYGGFEIVLLLERLLQAGDVYIDVGANIGYMTVNGSRIVGPNGCVLAIEPEPRVRAKLIHNIELNCANNVQIISRALAGEIGTTSFCVATEEGLSRLDNGHGDNPCMVLLEKIEVPTTTLDALVEELTPGRAIRLVKMDVEGFEHEIFKGASNLLQRGETIFIFESNPGALEQNGVSLVDIDALLTAAGYDLYAIRGHTADWLRIGRFPSFQRIVNASDYAAAHMDVIAIPNEMGQSLTGIVHD